MVPSRIMEPLAEAPDFSGKDTDHGRKRHVKNEHTHNKDRNDNVDDAFAPFTENGETCKKKTEESGAAVSEKYERGSVFPEIEYEKAKAAPDDREGHEKKIVLLCDKCYYGEKG